jgi:IS1 family transposase
MDPVCKLILAVDVGERTLAMAQRLVHHVTQVLAPEGAPLFLTDGFREYLTALVTHYGHWIQPERRQAKGPLPKLRWMPLPQLLYAQVIKSYRRKRVVGVKHRVVFGAAQTIESILAKRGWKINTSLIERLNLDFRQHVAAIGRRVNTLCKHESGCDSNWRSSIPITISCCPTRACACRCPIRWMRWNPVSAGSRGRRPWRLA